LELHLIPAKDGILVFFKNVILDLYLRGPHIKEIFFHRWKGSLFFKNAPKKNSPA